MDEYRKELREQKNIELWTVRGVCVRVYVCVLVCACVCLCELVCGMCLRYAHAPANTMEQ